MLDESVYIVRWYVGVGTFGLMIYYVEHLAVILYELTYNYELLHLSEIPLNRMAFVISRLLKPPIICGMHYLRAGQIYKHNASTLAISINYV